MNLVLYNHHPLEYNIHWRKPFRYHERKTSLSRHHRLLDPFELVGCCAIKWPIKYFRGVNESKAGHLQRNHLDRLWLSLMQLVKHEKTSDRVAKYLPLNLQPILILIRVQWYDVNYILFRIFMYIYLLQIIVMLFYGNEQNDSTNET